MHSIQALSTLSNKQSLNFAQKVEDQCLNKFRFLLMHLNYPIVFQAYLLQINVNNEYYIDIFIKRNEINHKM